MAFTDAVAERPDIGSGVEAVKDIGDLAGGTDVFTDLGKRAGANSHATMGAILDFPEAPAPPLEPLPPPAEVYSTAAIAEASAGPLGSTPIAEQAAADAKIAESGAKIDSLMRDGAANGANGARLEQAPAARMPQEAPATSIPAVDQTEPGPSDIILGRELSASKEDGGKKPTVIDGTASEVKPGTADAGSGTEDSHLIQEVAGAHQPNAEDIDPLKVDAEPDSGSDGTGGKGPGGPETAVGKGDDDQDDEETGAKDSIDLNAMTPEERNQYATAIDPEKRRQYQEWKDKSVADAEEKARQDSFDTSRPSDAIEGESYQDYEARKKSKQSSAEAEEPAEEQSQQPQTPEDIQKRMDDLAQKYKDGSITKDEEKEFKDLRGSLKDRARLTELEGKDPKDLKDEELDEMQALREKVNKPAEAPEKTAEQKREELDKLVQSKIDKLASGEDLTEEDVAELEQMDLEQLFEDKGFSAKEARLEAKKVIEKGKQRIKKELETQKQVKEKLQLMMGLELRALRMPERIETLGKQRDQLVGQIRGLESNTGSPASNDGQFAERMKIYTLKQQLNATKATLVMAKNEIIDIDQQYQEITDFVNKKLGLTQRGFLGSFMNKVGNILKGALSQADKQANEYLEYGA